MKPFQLNSRRNTATKVDFRPDTDPGSPFAQLRRFRSLLAEDVTADDITDCDTALAMYREFTYRKIFTGTTHEQYTETDKLDPLAIDWLIAIAGVDQDHFRSSKTNAHEKR